MPQNITGKEPQTTVTMSPAFPGLTMQHWEQLPVGGGKVSHGYHTNKEPIESLNTVLLEG